MIDTTELKEIINVSWHSLVQTFVRPDVSGSDAVSIMLTVVARYLSVLAEDASKKQKDFLRKEFINLIEEKLGK